MPWFVKKPIAVEMLQWDGTNEDELKDFAGGYFQPIPYDKEGQGYTAKVYDRFHDTWIKVKSGQYIVRGFKGEFYPMEPSVLAETYDEVTPPGTSGRKKRWWQLT